MSFAAFYAKRSFPVEVVTTYTQYYISIRIFQIARCLDQRISLEFRISEPTEWFLWWIELKIILSFLSWGSPFPEFNFSNIRNDFCFHVI